MAAAFFPSYSYAENITYDLAVKVKSNGEYQKAETFFNELIKKDSNNSELWYQLGLTQRFQQKNDDAMESQKKALELAPENYDIKIELARLYSWKKEYKVAEAMINEVLTAHPDYQDAIELKDSITLAKNAQVTPKKLKWQVDLGYENSDFSRRPQPDWHQYFLQLGYWLKEDTFVHIRTEDIKRFHNHNEHYEAGISHIFNDSYNGNLSVGYTPDSSFLPEWRIKTGGEARVIFNHEHIGNTWFTAAIQHDRYIGLNTTVIKPGIRYEILDNLQIHAQHINLIDENDDHLNGWSGRLDWQTPLPELRLFTGLSNAPETENAVSVDTKARFFGCSYQLTPKITVHSSYSREDRENSYIRHIITTALSIKF